MLIVAPAVLLMSACVPSANGADSGVSAIRKKYPTPMALAKARADCLNVRGWGVKVNDAAEIEASYPSDRQADYEKDNRDCVVQLGIDPDAPTPEKVVEKAYGLYKNGASCLRTAGWNISPAPSLQRFKDTYEAAPWYPWAEVPVADMTAALKLCPAPAPTY